MKGVTASPYSDDKEYAAEELLGISEFSIGDVVEFKNFFKGKHWFYTGTIVDEVQAGELPTKVNKTGVPMIPRPHKSFVVEYKYKRFWPSVSRLKKIPIESVIWRCRPAESKEDAPEPKVSRCQVVDSVESKPPHPYPYRVRERVESNVIPFRKPLR